MWLEMSLLLVKVKMEMLKAPVPTRCGGWLPVGPLPNSPHVMPGTPSERPSGCHTPVVLSYGDLRPNLQTSFLCVLSEGGLVASLLFLEGGRSS